MKKRMLKTVIAALLIISLIIPAVIPAFAVEPTITGSQVPVILISGDGAPLVNENDEEIFQFNKMFSGNKITADTIKSGIVSVLKPYILEGRLTGNYDNYYKAIYEVISPFFEDVRLDENGEVSNGTGLDGWRLWCNWYAQYNDQKGEKGYYGAEECHFWYDWRKDPCEVADELHWYIENIKWTTGCDKVAINCMCLGSNIVMAYLAKYGTGSLKGVTFDGSTVGGAEVLSEPVSGDFNLDGDAIVRFLYDCNGMDLIDIDPFIIDTVDMLEDAGVLQFVEDYTKLTVYDKVKKGVTSALSLSTFYTWPGYWAAVEADDFETAKKYIFGEEGSEKREQYAGLIEKLDNYHETVRLKIPEILKMLDESGINVGIIAKYGAQLAPICKSNDELGDQIASVKNASFGATTSTVYDTLSEDYISKRIAEGKGKYISPDKQIDASTCYFPDRTWFVKGARHSNWTEIEVKIVYTVATSDKQYTVDDFGYSQFIVYDNETQTPYAMTTENCNTYLWEANKKEDKSKNPFIRFYVFMKTLNKWYKSLFVFIGKKYNESHAPVETPTDA